MRIDRSLKDEGDAVLAEAGMSPTTIVRSLWAKLAQRGTALSEVVAALDAGGRTSEEQAAIDAKMAVVDRAARSRRSSGTSAAGATPMRLWAKASRLVMSLPVRRS